MAVRVELVDGKKADSRAFETAYSKVCDHIYFKCLDDQGNAQGHAVADVVKKYRADEDGAFLQLRYIQVEDQHYQHWLETSGGGSQYHHLCTHSLRSCQRKVGRDGMVHIQHWLAVDKDQVGSITRGWKTKPLQLGPPAPPRGMALMEEPIHTVPKPRPDRRGRDEARRHGHSPGDGQGGRGERARTPRREEDDSEEDDDAGMSNVPRRRRHREERRERDEDSREDRRGVLQRARGTVGAVARTRDAQDLKEKTPLTPCWRMEWILGGCQCSAGEESSRRSRSRPQQRSKRSEREKLTGALKALSKKSKDVSLSFDSDTDDEDEGYLRSSSKDGDLMSKQKRLKKLSASKPGSLLARGFGLMHEQLGTLFGDKGSGGSHEDLLPPAALRYLFSSALPLMDLKKVGEEKMRELRTLATSLDYLVAGKVGQSGDIQMQRMKSILMGIKDGSTTASRYLELFPIELYPTAATIEEADLCAWEHHRAPALKANKRPKSPSRSRSPLERKVQFDPKVKEIQGQKEDAQPGP